MSSQLTERGSLDVESEMLPQEPPPWIIRSTAWLLLAAFLFALLVAIVMRLPETVVLPVRSDSGHRHRSNPIASASHH